jgi:NAD-dependent SIR2 family protein deacetylase
VTTPDNRDVAALQTFLDLHRRIVVLTGAGISAESGIPTYRDRDGAWRRSEPIRHQDFIGDPATRRRYWARSFHGWPVVAAARSNEAHHALAKLEALGHVELLITQNVDRLHQQAGSQRVVDLHGRLDRVGCLQCNGFHSREAMQDWLATANPQLVHSPAAVAPDGDADLPEEQLAGIAVPECPKCAGTLMPDVVFFGGTVPRDRVEACHAAVARADALLAVGSSLQVFSGYRFCRQAAQLGKPVAVINPGPTRADALASAKFATEAAPLLAAIVPGRRQSVKRDIA